MKLGPAPAQPQPLCFSKRRRPNHDHDHFLVHLAGPHFSFFNFLGYPGMAHQMPLLHSVAQRKHKDLSSDVPSNAVFENYGCGCVWAVPLLFFGPPLTQGSGDKQTRLIIGCANCSWTCQLSDAELACGAMVVLIWPGAYRGTHLAPAEHESLPKLGRRKLSLSTGRPSGRGF